MVLLVTASNAASWEQGNNYARGTVTIDGSNPVLGVYVASPGGSGGFDADNATIAAIQIVPVPEPASIPLVVLGSVFIATGGRRRREG